MKNFSFGKRSLRIRWGAAIVLVLAAATPGAAGVPGNPCTGVVIGAEPGSELDEGTAGSGHDTVVPAGTTTSWTVLKRCSEDQSPCTDDNDCTGTCDPTCDCGSDTTCELAGPADGRKCITNLADCTTNADCPSSVACVHFFGPPMPVSYAGTSFCAMTHFEGEASGSYDSGTGDVSLSAKLRRRHFAGEEIDQPCPRCGPPEQNPEAGAQFTCEGGQRNGLACTVEGVHPLFGGTSTDCPPNNGDILTGSGYVMALGDFGTGTKTKTAALQCQNAALSPNPLVPASNPKCIDDLAGPVCTSNADCLRCSGDPTTECTTNADCTGKGSCAAAPDQPITCGYWCHCGFCNNDATRPCFESADCPNGQTCQKGTGAGTSGNAPQQKPNECSDDAFICGTADAELCEEDQVGHCSLEPFRSCSGAGPCEAAMAGTCVFEDRPCFGSRISRSGTADPLGQYCAFQDKACSSNNDCGIDDLCVPNSSRARMVGLYCQGTSQSAFVNSTVGVAGPGAVTLDAFVRVCRCDGSELGCDVGCGPVTECGNNVVEAGEECDGGACCDDNCALLASTTVCRGTSGNCDVAESCTGSSAACPANVFLPTTTPCRGTAGVCDVAESCTGTSASCPANGFVAASTACRPLAGVCDVTEACTGSTADCPANAVAASSVTCRASTDQCDREEKCNGTAVTCPANADQPDGTACSDGDICTTNDQCDNGSCEGTAIPSCGAECGDGTLDDGEQCDDGNATFTNGEYCGVSCVLIPCGKPTNSSGTLPKSSDALFVLRTAVDQEECSPRVCDVDDSGSIVSTDALRVLRAAVGQVVTLNCPDQ